VFGDYSHIQRTVMQVGKKFAEFKKKNALAPSDAGKPFFRNVGKFLQGDQKLSVHLMITTQKVTINVQSVPHQSPDIY
jgi:hypothetical protein